MCVIRHLVKYRLAADHMQCRGEPQSTGMPYTTMFGLPFFFFTSEASGISPIPQGFRSYFHVKGEKAPKRNQKNEERTYLHFFTIYLHRLNHKVNPDGGSLSWWEKTLNKDEKKERENVICMEPWVLEMLIFCSSAEESDEY